MACETVSLYTYIGRFTLVPFLALFYSIGMPATVDDCLGMHIHDTLPMQQEMMAAMEGSKSGKEVEELDPASSARHSKEGTKAQRWIDASSVQSRSNVPQSLDPRRSQFEEVGTRAQGQMTPSVQEPVFNYVHGSGLPQFMMLGSFR